MGVRRNARPQGASGHTSAWYRIFTAPPTQGGGCERDREIVRGGLLRESFHRTPYDRSFTQRRGEAPDIARRTGLISETALPLYRFLVPLRDRCSFGRFPWLISQALSVTYMAGERRLYLERNCRLPESPAHSRRRNREGPASSKGLNSQRGFGPAVEPRRKSRPRSTSLHGSSPCKCQRLSTLRWDRLPPSRPSTKSGARAGGRRLSDRRLHRWLAGTSASAPSSHGAADLLGLNRAHICVRNQISQVTSPGRSGRQRSIRTGTRTGRYPWRARRPAGRERDVWRLVLLDLR